ncbi:MAG: hypothetical protein AAF657_02675 [Acidobacteriota bacterium]
MTMTPRIATSCSRLSTALIGATALFIGTASPLAAQVLKSADGDLLLPAGEGRSQVQLRDGRQIELPFTAKARVSDFRAAEGRWFAAAVARDAQGPRLELATGDGDRVDSLAAPTVTDAPLLAQPIFVTDTARVHALAWLEGGAHNRLAVHAARRVGNAWGTTEIISPAGLGTQTALTSTVLADGTWLLAWAAYDGTDDEILWSRWSNGAWSAPQPVATDNRVPDITPTLRATAEGALLAWSRYDGNDYRVNVAHFDGIGWTEPAIIGTRGSTFPRFSDVSELTLTYQHADPRAWAVAELDATGQVLRRATVAEPRPDRPFLAVSGSTVTLEWAGVHAKTLSLALAAVE